MKRFIVPALAVAAGIAASEGLQAAEVSGLVARLIGLGVVALVIAYGWRRAARA